MGIVQSATPSRQAKNTITKFTIALGKNNSVEFRPTQTFAKINTERVLKIITKGIVDVTAENNNNKVNFKLTGGTKLLGFINYFDNDLDDESELAEVTEVVDELQAQLQAVTIGDISLPMTAGQADDFLDEL
jgi:hypothetical protein